LGLIASEVKALVAFAEQQFGGSIFGLTHPPHILAEKANLAVIHRIKINTR
jgi:hypothetical protein